MYRLRLLPLALCFISLIYPNVASACKDYSCEFCWETCYGLQGCSGRLCQLSCFCASPVKKSYLDQLQPGLTTDYAQGGLVVSTVLPGSPASDAGIVPGDRLLLIDGDVPWLLSCERQVWGGSGSDRTVLTILHGNETRSVAIQFKRIEELLALLWTGASGSQLRDVALSGERLVESYPLGLRFVMPRGRARAVQVLPGGAAENAGIRPGDVISKVNGIPVAQYDFARASIGEVLQFDILRGSASFRVPVTVQALSAVFRGTTEATEHRTQLMARRYGNE